MRHVGNTYLCLAVTMEREARAVTVSASTDSSFWASNSVWLIVLK